MLPAEFRRCRAWPVLIIGVLLFGMLVGVDHDDAEREYAYRSEAASFTADESVGATATRLEWTTVGMRNDLTAVYPS